MTYTFYACYHQFNDEAYTLRLAESLVLEEWRACLERNKVPHVSGAKLTFTSYKFSEYPTDIRGELLKNWVSHSFRNSYGDLCSFGEYFDTVEDLIKRLDQEKMLMELRVEVDE